MHGQERSRRIESHSWRGGFLSAPMALGALRALGAVGALGMLGALGALGPLEALAAPPIGAACSRSSQAPSASVPGRNVIVTSVSPDAREGSSLLPIQAEASAPDLSAALICTERPAVLEDRGARAHKPRVTGPGAVLSGWQVFLDPKTGTIGDPTDGEDQELSLAFTKMFLPAELAAPVTIEHPNGMLSMVVRGRFLSFSMARFGRGGLLEGACMSDPGAAASFLQGTPGLFADTRVRVSAGSFTGEQAGSGAPAPEER